MNLTEPNRGEMGCSITDRLFEFPGDIFGFGVKCVHEDFENGFCGYTGKWRGEEILPPVKVDKIVEIALSPGVNRALRF